MQRGLIDHRAGQKRVAVLFQRDGQAFKPGGPLAIKVSLEANFIKSRLVMIFG